MWKCLNSHVYLSMEPVILGSVTDVNNNNKKSTTNRLFKRKLENKYIFFVYVLFFNHHGVLNVSIGNSVDSPLCPSGAVTQSELSETVGVSFYSAVISADFRHF